MSKNLFAWASLAENGKVDGGKAGNQNGKELKVGELYEFGADSVFRLRDSVIRVKVSKIALILAENIHIGYSQKNRATLYSLAKSCGWDVYALLKRLASTDVECDCSSFYATVINLAYGKTVVPIFTTSTMADVAKKDARFDVIPITKVGKSFKKGDGVYKGGKHVIINV